MVEFMSAKDDVDPEIRQFIDRVTADYSRHQTDNRHDFPARRLAAEIVRAPWAQGGPDMARMFDCGIAGTWARIYQPTNEKPKGTLIYLHGGGWVMFSIQTHDRLMREYAARTGMTVVGIDYALAPEHRYPVALHQIENVISTLRSEPDFAHLNLDYLAIGGDSAGANLALATALQLRDKHCPADGLLLNYGAFDTVQHPSYIRYDGPRYMLTAEEMAEFWQHYLGSQMTLEDPICRPLRADMTGLPPTFICIPQCDILADENRMLAEKMRQANVPVTSIEYSGATHSFLEAVSISSLADKAIQDAADWLIRQTPYNQSSHNKFVAKQ